MDDNGCQGLIFDRMQVTLHRRAGSLDGLILALWHFGGFASWVEGERVDVFDGSN